MSSVIGIGTDIIEIERIASVYAKWGKAFLDRLFTDEEAAYCLARKQAVSHLAARWAAKEAVAKALGVGFGSSLGWRDIAIGSDANGRPTVALQGEAASRFAGITILLSMSHSQEHATATAVALQNQ